MVRYGKVIILFFILLQIIFESLKHRTAYIILSYIFAIIMTLYAASSFGLLVVEMRKPKFKWNLSTTYLTYGILLPGFYLAPSNMGKASGFAHINPSSSKLPIVLLKDSKEKYRLLQHNAVNDTYYIFEPEKTQDYPRIHLVDKSQIKSIKKKKTGT